MDKFRRILNDRLAVLPMEFKRGILYELPWGKVRLMGVKGPRGVGKSTMLLQYIKENLPIDDRTLYISLDMFWYEGQDLLEYVDEFVKYGGENLFLDEVHFYPEWSRALKTIYDSFPELNVVYTGSSMLEILNAQADLSRRSLNFEMQGLSLREYIAIETGLEFPKISLAQILNENREIVESITKEIKPLKFFRRYLENGYYPIYREGTPFYSMKIREVINMILEIELPRMRQLDTAYVERIKQLLQIIAVAVPFVPNIHKLSERIGISWQTLIKYLRFLEEAKLIRNLYKDAKGITKLQKPDKIYLDNPNLMYVFSYENVDRGTLRETFFANQVGFDHNVEYGSTFDFTVDDTFYFEVVGKSKNKEELPDNENAYLVKDDIEFGFGNTIPLWLFGFLY